jgi:hypothetical protein
LSTITNDILVVKGNIVTLSSNVTSTNANVAALQIAAGTITTLAGDVVTLNNQLLALTANVVLTNANSNLGGHTISGMTQTVHDHGAVTGAVSVDYNAGEMQTMTTSGPVTLTLTGWPTTGVYAKMRVWATASSITDTITFPAAVSVGLSKVPGAAGQVVTPAAVGNFLLELSTVDGGATVLVVPLITP